jgi:histidine decarboxylase
MLQTNIDHTLEHTESRLRIAHSNHLGYPYNLVLMSHVPPAFGNYMINNLGDPYAGSHYGSDVCDLEREAVAWLMGLWQCGDPRLYWGSVGASGTEGNLWALYLAREALRDAVLLHSTEAHYSIPKAARILRIEALSVECGPGGAIDLAALSHTLNAIGRRSVILALTCGTTMTGAHDDIQAAVECVEHAGFDRERRFVHVDGALNAMVLPFLPEARSAIVPSFRHGIDSLSTSGHKMIGTPMPCGVLIARRRYVNQVASEIAHLRSNDTTLMGSRNGHAVLALWARLKAHGAPGFAADARACLDRATHLAAQLTSAKVPVLHNPHSLTVVFPEPSEAIVRKYQLACQHGQAHAITMPSVSETLLDRFVNEYLAWWTSQGMWARIAQVETTGSIVVGLPADLANGCRGAIH